MTIIGIDLGTTNSAAAIWQDGKPQLIPNRLGSYLTPSVVGLDDDSKVMVGEPARYRLISHPHLTASLFKRYMGSDHQILLGSQHYNAPELSALVLRSLKEDAETFIGEAVTQAVISVPAYFNDAQRKATKLAGELAGLQVERLVNEPTAAAMVYGLHERNEGSRYMVLDLGGGTFDVSIVDYFEGIIEVHASSGDNHLGGEDFLNLMVQRFLSDNDIEADSLTPSARQHLFDALEQSKKELTSSHTVTVEGVLPQQDTAWQISRSDFEQLVAPLLSRVQAPMERTLRDANILPEHIGEVVLVGGATRMHAFRALIARMLRRMPAATFDPDLVVAMGAAVQAGLKERHTELDDVVLTDVSPYSLGVNVLNENDPSGRYGDLFLPIIERNSVVPISVERTLYTVHDNQKHMVVRVYQGESRLVKNNVYLGELSVAIPKARAGEESVNVRYSYDMNGLLEVDVTVNSTGKTYHKTIINSPTSLTPRDIEKSHAKLSKLKFHPREGEENRRLLARAERLYESALGDRRDYLQQVISQFEHTLEQQNPKTIKHHARELDALLSQLEEDNTFL